MPTLPKSKHYPESRATLDGLVVPCIVNYFLWETYHIQFQPILQDIAGDTVVQLGADNQANLQNNRIHITNNREWSGEQNHRIGEVDHQEEKGRI